MGFVPDQLFDFLWNKCGARAPNVQALGGKVLLGQKRRSAGFAGGRDKFVGPGANFKPTPECKAASIAQKVLCRKTRNRKCTWDLVNALGHSDF
jgi:hypothetical protein